MLMNLCICWEIYLSSRFTSIVLWPRMTHPVPMLSQNACCGWGAWCNSQTLLHQSAEQSSVISGPGLNSSPLEARNPSIVHVLIAATFYKEVHKHLWELSFFSQLTNIPFIFLEGQGKAHLEKCRPRSQQKRRETSEILVLLLLFTHGLSWEMQAHLSNLNKAGPPPLQHFSYLLLQNKLPQLLEI